MTKLQAWKKWLAATGSSDGMDEWSLKRSSHGKTFSVGWNSAIEAIGKRLSEFGFDLRELKDTPLNTLDMPVWQLPLDVRAHNCLRAEGITTVRKLLTYNENMLLRIPNMGRKSAAQIRDILAQFDFRLGEMPLKIVDVIHPTPAPKPPRKPRANVPNLARRDEKIYRARVIGNRTFKDIGEEFGVSPSRVDQIVRRITRHKKRINAQDVDPIRSAAFAATLLETPPWREERTDEPSHDQRS